MPQCDAKPPRGRFGYKMSRWLYIEALDCMKTGPSTMVLTAGLTRMIAQVQVWTEIDDL